MLVFKAHAAAKARMIWVACAGTGVMTGSLVLLQLGFMSMVCVITGGHRKHVC